MPKRKVKATRGKAKKRSLWPLVLLLILLPIVLVAVMSIQDLRQRASEPATAATLAPKGKMAKFVFADTLPGDDEIIEGGNMYLPTQDTPTLHPLTIETWMNSDTIRQDRATGEYSPTFIAYRFDNFIVDHEKCGGFEKTGRLRLYQVPHDNGYHVEAELVANQKSYFLSQSKGDASDKLLFNQWSHVALTLNTSNQATLFVNGKKKDFVLLPHPVCNPQDGIIYGADMGGQAFYRYYSGLLDNVRISKIVRYRNDFVPALSYPTGDANNWHFSHFNNGKLPNQSADRVEFPTSTLPTSFDSTGPNVAITAPANNSDVAVNSTVTITAPTGDPSGVSRVAFFVKDPTGTSQRVCNDTTRPFTCNWVVPNTPNTSYTLTARAVDTLGNVKDSTPITVTGR